MLLRFHKLLRGTGARGRVAAGFILTLDAFALVGASPELGFAEELIGSEPQAREERSSETLPNDLTEVGLKALLNFDLTVTSAGKKEETLSDVASAIFVLSGEEIRRSGVRHVAEALRLVPGVTVARVSSNQWAISVRGFTQVFANKLLVLVDGISIYSPTINGVYWETNELPIEDIDRIEVIRGPGAALWGANAVNGVINIITKSSKDTQGGLLVGGGGTHERGFVSSRYGGELSEDTTYRTYVRYNDRGPNRYEAGGEADDDWAVLTGGFRIDSRPTDEDSFLVAGRGHHHDSDKVTTSTPSLDPPFIDNESFSGNDYWNSATGSAEWTHSLSETSSLKSTGSYRFLEETSDLISFEYHIFNLDQEFRSSGIDGHDIVGGVGYRFFSLQSEGSFAQHYDPNSRKTDLFTLFAQDEMTIVRDRLFFIAGSKFEKNAHTGFELMPNGRLVWTPNKKESIWAAVSRAVSSPAIVFEDIVLPAAAFPVDDQGNVGVATILGQRNIVSEDLIAYELGYRKEFSKDLSLDVATFYNSYDDIFSFEPGAPFVGSIFGQRPVLVLPQNLANALRAESVGGEIATEWRPIPTLRLVAAYSYIHTNVSLGDSQDLVDKELIEGGTPQHQVQLPSLYNVTEALELDATLRYVDRIAAGDIPDYFEGDLRLGYRVSSALRLSIVGQNLLDAAHKEFVGNLFGPPPIELERGVYGQAELTF